MRAIIIDDELHCTQTLESMLLKYTKVEVIAIFNDALQALKKLQVLEADILFLDIEMPYVNGFELLQFYDPYPWKVVFTTAYNEYAIKALKANAVDYLLKPIMKDDLLEAVDHCLRLTNENYQKKVEQVVNKDLLNMVQKVAIPSLSGIELLPPEEIIYLEADNNYTKFFLSDNSEILSSRTLKTFENYLTKIGFVRIHHSHIVNLKYIRRYVKGDGGYIVLDNGDHLNVSRSRKDDLLNRITNSTL